MLAFLGPTVFFVVLGYIHHTRGESLKPVPTTNNEGNFIPISSRNYGDSAESANSYYTSYPGYPTYGSTSASGVFNDPYNPSDYPPSYYSGSTDPKKKPGPPSYPFYPSPGLFATPECQEQMMNGVIGDILQTGGFANFGLLKSVVAAVTAGLLAKIPVILAIKALLIKLILVPFGLFVLSLPFILPIALLFTPLWTKLKETFTGTTAPTPTVVVMMGNETNATPAKGRELNGGRNVLAALMESDRCLEKLACLVGSRDAHSPLVKPVSWLLKFLQTFKFVQSNMEIRSTLKRYREAYLQGVTEGRKLSNSTNMENVCPNEIYPCDTPHLYARPEFTSYSRYL